MRSYFQFFGSVTPELPASLCVLVLSLDLAPLVYLCLGVSILLSASTQDITDLAFNLWSNIPHSDQFSCLPSGKPSHTGPGILYPSASNIKDNNYIHYILTVSKYIKILCSLSQIFCRSYWSNFGHNLQTNHLPFTLCLTLIGFRTLNSGLGTSCLKEDKGNDFKTNITEDKKQNSSYKLK